jgi:hypothetical protein
MATRAPSEMAMRTEAERPDDFHVDLRVDFRVATLLLTR